MACAACERRRKEMALMMAAAKEWTAKPTGPNINTIYLRLRAEAIARGDFDDGIVRPSS